MNTITFTPPELDTYIEIKTAKAITAEREECAQLLERTITEIRAQSSRKRLNSVDEHVVSLFTRTATAIRARGGVGNGSSGGSDT